MQRNTSIFLILASCATAHAAPPKYTIRDLGVTPGGGIATAECINNLGEALGQAHREESSSSSRAPIFWAASGAVDLLPQMAFIDAVRVMGLNDRGDAIFEAFPPFEVGIVYLRRNGQLRTGFVSAPPGAAFYSGWRLNSLGQIAGAAAYPPAVPGSPAIQHIVRWDASGQNPVLLGSLGWQAAPNAMNTAGDIAGLSYLTPSGEGGFHPIVIRNDIMTDLSVAYPADKMGQALSINDAGVCVGYLQQDVAPPFGDNEQPVRWNAAGQRIFLPKPPGALSGQAKSINLAGDAVGYVSSELDRWAVLWDEDGAHNLADLIQGGLQEWEYLYEAYAINDRGQIVGWGSRMVTPTHQDLRAFILTPVCAANCDGSTTSPVLTANDFMCFVNLYISGDPAANCDGSVVPPLLTGNDFLCFMNEFVSGCP